MADPAILIPPHHTPAGRAQVVIPALLGALGVVLVIGVGSLIVAAWPFAFSDTRWRVQTESVVLAATFLCRSTC